VRENLG